MIEIRKIKGKKDLKERFKIEQKELYPELTKEQLEEWMEGEGVFSPQSFVVSLNGEIVGFCVFEIYEVNANEIIISLDAIAIKKESQKQGIGRYLLETSLEEAKKYWSNKDFKVKGLIIETGTNEAVGFYEKVFPSSEKKTFPDIWSDGEGIVHFLFHL